MSRDTAKKKSLPDRRWQWTLLGFGVVILLEVWFFRQVLFTDALIGDMGDARFNSFLQEHWFRVFSGQEPATNLPIFYPLQHTIAYSDMMLGTGVIYSAFRFLGCDMFLANKLALITLHAVGMVGFYLLFRVKLRAQLWQVFCGLVTGLVANNLTIRYGHTQIFALGILPVLLCFLYTWIEKQNRPVRVRIFYGMAAVLSLVLCLYTSYYSGFFFLLFVMVLAGCALVLLIAMGKKSWLPVWRWGQRFWWELCLYAGVFVLAMVPFLRIYLAQLAQSGGRVLGQACIMLLRPVDYLNVGTNNLLYGSLFSRLHAWARAHEMAGLAILPWLMLAVLAGALLLYVGKLRKGWQDCHQKRHVWFWGIWGFAALAAVGWWVQNHFFFALLSEVTERGVLYEHELSAGFAPLTLGLMLVAVFVCVRTLIRKHRNKTCDPQTIFIAALGISVMVSLLLILRVGLLSVWPVIFYLVPGASAIRAVSRYAAFLSLPISLLLVLFLRRYLPAENIRQRVLRYGCILLLPLLLWAENTQRGSTLATWSISAQNAVTERVSPPPSDCEILFLIAEPADQVRLDYYNFQLDAWQIAYRYNLKTLNGYSGMFPPDWELRQCDAPGYLDYVGRWVMDHNLPTDHLYAYHLQQDAWIPYAELTD